MDKIFGGWEWAGYDEPSYEVAYGPDRTTLTLPLAQTGESTGDRTQKAANSSDKADIALTPSELAVLNVARDRGKVTTRMATEATGLSRQASSALLKRLAAKGHLTWHGNSQNDPRQYYSVPTDK